MKFNEPTNPWLDADTDLLRQLVAENASNAEISDRMGRSILAIKSKLTRLALPPRVRVQKAWPPEVTAQLIMLRDEARLGWTEIAKRLGRSSGTCWSKYAYIKNSTPKNKIERREPIDMESHREWRRRQMLSPVSLTAALLGDPLPGYSALDKRA